MAELSPTSTPPSVPASARPRPTLEQHLAADPESSVWVSASAGSGKTRVLADRLLRLLLNGADPASVLCLTYTKAGAAEMARRVQDDLARFAWLPVATLREEIENLLGRPPDAEEISRARSGLLEVLDLPAGLRIMTIHSFCQSLLRRFPVEAEIVPHFEVMEPRAAAALLERARDEVLTDRTPVVRDAVETLAVALGEHSFGEGLSALNAGRAEFARLLSRHRGDVDAVVGEVFSTFDVELGLTVERLRDGLIDDPALDEPGLLAASSALATGTKTDVLSADRIRLWIEVDRCARIERLPDYLLVFLTKDRDPRKRLASKAVAEGFPHVFDALAVEQARLAASAEQEKAIKVAEKTAALIRVGAAIIQAYERRKQAEGKLDYADLIEASRELLADREAAGWVRYKLDQRIDHLLIDESQDTSPDQWDIALALIDDFFSGEGRRERPPTLFVVGDEKQSIFGFQGADVATFQHQRQQLKARARAAGLEFLDAPLRRSFRSSQAVLDAVDAVFERPEVARGVHSEGEPLRHDAFKRNMAGLVEVWPLVEQDKVVEEATEGWALPDQLQLQEPPELRLAQAIAERIRVWLLDRVPLANQDRPITPGDIMILLPRRGVLQDFLVRELKRSQVPVAGADRIGLTDELAVMDLMALGDALLLPEDDLTVATVLRSPLFGFSDRQLFDLAYERGDRPLYRRLHDLRGSDPAFAAADDRFSALLTKIDYVPPYEFFATFLSEGVPNGRQLLLRRLGPAAVLPIDAFLAQAIAYERSRPPSMQGFLHWLRADSEAIKRDSQDARDEVRVLTVHGSKGLEAPIVFLADATYQKTMRMDRLLWQDDGLPLWKVAEKERDPWSERIHERQKQRQQEEHRRLLYVAMTRAEERLIVAGCRRGRSADGELERDGDSWYDLIVAGLERLPDVARVPMSLPSGLTGEGWRFGDGAADRQKTGQTVMAFAAGANERAGPPLPDWLAAAVRGEAAPEQLRPSADLEADDPPAASPLTDDGQRRFGRGLLIHKLLQLLPDLPTADRSSAARRYLDKPGLDLDPQAKEAIAAEVAAILDNPDWRDLFGPTSRAEVPLVGEVRGQRVSGQVDRLSVQDDEVMVVDYKTNRPPPREQGDVSPAYGRQMAIYRALLRQIYPERRVRCALLWTEGPRLMILDDVWLDAFDAPSSLASA